MGVLAPRQKACGPQKRPQHLCSTDSAVFLRKVYGRYTEVSGDQDVEPAGTSGKLAAAGELRGTGGEGGWISPATWSLHSGRDHPGN